MELIDELITLQEQEKELKKRIGAVKDAIYEANKADIENALKAKDEPFGVVNVGRVSFTLPKKVEWDQERLAQLYREIGDTASEYMDVSYKVRETAFKNWPSAIQDAFIPARTVSTGSIQIKVKENA